MDELTLRLDAWWMPITLLLAMLLGGLLLHALLYAVARRVAVRTAGTIDELLVERTRAPARLLIPMLLVGFIWPSLDGVRHMPPSVTGR